MSLVRLGESIWKGHCRDLRGIVVHDIVGLFLSFLLYRCCLLIYLFASIHTAAWYLERIFLINSSAICINENFTSLRFQQRLLGCLWILQLHVASGLRVAFLGSLLRRSMLSWYDYINSWLGAVPRRLKYIIPAISPFILLPARLLDHFILLLSWFKRAVFGSLFLFY